MLQRCSCPQILFTRCKKTCLFGTYPILLHSQELHWWQDYVLISKNPSQSVSVLFLLLSEHYRVLQDLHRSDRGQTVKRKLHPQTCLLLCCSISTSTSELHLLLLFLSFVQKNVENIKTSWITCFVFFPEWHWKGTVIVFTNNEYWQQIMPKFEGKAAQCKVCVYILS